MWFRNSVISQPGEYGTKVKPDGWVMLTVPELPNQRIFLASENFAKKLAQHFNIPNKNIVNLISPAPLSKKGVPEELLAGNAGLEIFTERFKNINHKTNPVLIHCKQGLNRTPVAAVLYLINQNIDPERAAEIVTVAYRQQRDENFVLNKRGHYTLVLEAAGLIIQPNLQRRRSCKRNTDYRQH
ncbi:MAG TPA: protein-tyrosine phosphatase family protein [Gammaproteobacteria bacterium]|jgi:hypothetical protein|nr:protein-tyrosine phosphatase family protein [Gammaproteobacteria bacterium]